MQQTAFLKCVQSQTYVAFSELYFRQSGVAESEIANIRNFGEIDYGKPFTEETQKELLEALSPDYIAGLTLLGGDPMEPENQRALLPFVRRVRRELPRKTIWCYTGYTFKDGALEEEQSNCEVTRELISLFDVLVDGRFVEELKDIRLVFRGSSNQRVIDVQRTLSSGNIVLYLT